MSDDVNVIA